MIRIFVIFLFTIYCGTALAKKYAAPLTNPAYLRVVLVNPDAYSLHIAEYDPIVCKKGADVGWVSGGRNIDTVRTGMPGSEAPREGILERRIPSNRSFAFGTSFIIPKQSIMSSLFAATSPAGASADALYNAQAAICEVPVFTAKPEEAYELVLQPLPQRCESNLYRLQIDADGNVQRELMPTPRISFPKSLNKPVCPALN